MREPTQTCAVCGDVEVVYDTRKGFPPAQAVKRLAKRCGAKGHECAPVYRAGVR